MNDSHNVENLTEAKKGIINDMIKNISDDELKQILSNACDEDEFEGLVWQRYVKHEAQTWYGGVSNKKKFICLSKSSTTNNDHNLTIIQNDTTIIESLQEEVRKLYLDSGNVVQKKQRILGIVDRVRNMEYLLSDQSGYNALRTNTVDKFIGALSNLTNK